MKIAFVTFFFQKSNTSHDERETLFKERDETPCANHTLSLSLSVRALKTHLLWTKERNFKRKERERGKREREFLRSFFFSERERERKNFDFEISRFSSICTHSRF